MDERVNCMACVSIDDNDLVPGVVVVDGITHALATTSGKARHYMLCDFDENGTLLPGAYYGRLIKTDRILWTNKEHHETG